MPLAPETKMVDARNIQSRETIGQENHVVST